LADVYTRGGSDTADAMSSSIATVTEYVLNAATGRRH